MGQDNNTQDGGRQPQQQNQNPNQSQPNQQNQQGGGQQGGQQGGQRIDTDGDGRTRDPNDTRPSDDGGKGDPVQR